MALNMVKYLTDFVTHGIQDARALPAHGTEHGSIAIDLIPVVAIHSTYGNNFKFG